MAQSTDLVVPNSSGAAFRSAVNTRFQAVATHQSGPTEPLVKYPYQFWADTTAGLWKQRNGANTAWISHGPLDTAGWGFATNAALNAAVALRAPLASPTFTGTPVVPNLNGGQLAGMRNRIINGAMAIDRRNSGASVSCPANALTYTLDRWAVFATGAAVSVSRANISSNGFTNALRITGAAGNTAVQASQRIEAANSADLAGKTVTVSFYAATSNSVNMNCNLYNATAADNFASQTTIGSNSFATTSAYTLYSFTFTVPAGGANGLAIDFGVSGGLTSGTIDVFGVQLETGSQATPFEWRSRALEQTLCERYFYRPAATWNHQSYGVVNSNSKVFLAFPTEMRATPTIVASWAALVAATAGATSAVGTIGAVAQINCTSSGDYAGNITWTSFSAEL